MPTQPPPSSPATPVSPVASATPAIRLAQLGDSIYLDLADPAGRLIHISPTGWRIQTPTPANPAPLHFSRPPGMLALPEPVREEGTEGLGDVGTEGRNEDPPDAEADAASSTSQIPPPTSHISSPPTPISAPPTPNSLSSLLPLLNLPDHDAWVLFLAWLVAALRPDQPCPILVLTGEQGTGKTTLARIARALIDPNAVPLRAPPRHDHDLASAALAGWVAAFDNLSATPPALADGLARLVTGGAFSAPASPSAPTPQPPDPHSPLPNQTSQTSNQKSLPSLFEARRPIIINGIDNLATRADLLDRCINLRLPPIPDDRRLAEAQIWDRFHALRPRVLAALLDAVAAALANSPTVQLPFKPRMADFALWVTAAEPALPWPPGTFLAAYRDNRQSSSHLAMESSPVAAAVVDLMSTTDGRTWSGPASDLYKMLVTWYGHRHKRALGAIGLNPRKLAGEVRRLAPNLRALGISVSFGPHTREGNTITLSNLPTDELKIAK